MSKFFDQLGDDPLAEVLSGEVRTTPAVVPANYKPVDYSEPCPKCRGRGRFVSYSGRDCGPCFACKGAGKKSFKTSPAQRAQAKASASARKDRLAADTAKVALDWCEAHPEVVAWIAANPSFEFAVAMKDAIAKYGSLTEKQLAACERLVERAKERKAEAAARIVNAPTVDTAGVDRLKAAFDKAVAFAQAKASGLTIRNPKITIGGVVISPAKANSKNPGALYVKSGETYLGKIVDGKFYTSRDCTKELEQTVLGFIANPAEAAKAYGQETGTCCICNATLTSEWRLRGIGPICAEKFGF